jgi:ribosomal protein S19
MQTFLPYSDFLESANVLDFNKYSRLWKQILEAKQLLTILRKIKERAENDTTEKIGYEYHPAIKMWSGQEELLTHYINNFIQVYNLKKDKELELLPISISFDDIQKPWWFENKYLHDSHKAIEGFLHSKEHGQIARITHIFSLLLLFGTIFAI